MRLLDLFCGAGGAAMGYSRAGFEVVGVDIKPQPNYPFRFVRADAFEVLGSWRLRDFAAIHASPPCQGYSIMRNLPWLRDKEYPLLIEPTRERLQAAGVPYVIENVAGARRTEARPDGMQAGWLCGGMFGLPFFRHRYFETSFFWMQPAHPKHVSRIRAGNYLGSRAREIVYGASEDARGLASWPGRREVPAGLATSPGRREGAGGIGHNKGWREAAAGMGIDWMKCDELTQAVPPIFAEYIGKELMRVLEGGKQKADP